jgi:tellurite resistance protein
MKRALLPGHARFGVPDVVSDIIGAVAVVAFVFVTCGYGVKIVTAREAVQREFAHPIAGNLFGTFLISLLLLPIILAPLSRIAARTMWAIGAIGMIGFAWFIVDRWMSQRQKAAHATPAWIIPVVGLLDAPLSMPALGMESMHGVMVFGLAVGLFFTVPLFTLVFSRLLFEEPLPVALQPSLMILVAPFAVGTSAYIATMGQVDVFAQSLFALTLFMLAVLLGRLRCLAACCPFRVSWGGQLPAGRGGHCLAANRSGDTWRVDGNCRDRKLALATIFDIAHIEKLQLDAERLTCRRDPFP